jgi:WhiB family redox-sensing transcriptional regulator
VTVDLDWRQRGECRSHDGEWWFPDEFRGAIGKRIEARAKAICALCDVEQKCLDWALERDIRFGVWGGLSAPERARLRERK